MTQTAGHKRVNWHAPPKTHAALHQWCRKQGITLQDGLTKMVETSLRIPLSAWNPQPVDTSGLFTHRPAAAPAPRFAQPAAEPANEIEDEPEPLPLATREEMRNGQITADCYTIPLDWMSSDDRTRAQVIADGEADDPGYQYYPPEMAAAVSPPNGAPPAAAEPDPAPFRYTPREFAIPPDWVNMYGLTLEKQNLLERNDDLEYGPPSARAGLAH